MRQAYDYWQNQPGNYRAPGLADRPCFRAEELLSYRYGGPFQVPHPSPARPAWPDVPEKGIHLPPLGSPERRQQVQERPRGCRVPPKHPKRRPRSQRFSYSASPKGGYLPMLFSRCSNLPTAHRAHPAALRDGSQAPSRQPDRSRTLRLQRSGALAAIRSTLVNA